MRKRLSGLDALRGIAALIVAWDHLQSTYKFEIVKVSAVSAVDFFMVMSGFVMARTYEPQMPKDFIIRRYRRLLPTMAIGSTLGVIVAFITFGPDVNLLPAFAAILIFMPWPYMGLFGINVPVWSLFAEIVANALHRMAFAKLPNWWLGAAIVVLALSFAIATFRIGQVPWGETPKSLAGASVRCLCCYLIGIAMWRANGERSFAAPALALLGLPVLLIAGAYLNALLFSVAFALVGAPLLVLAGKDLAPSRIASVSGAASFPLYAIHCPIIGTGYYFGVPAPLTFCFCLIAAIASAQVKFAGPIRPASLDRGPTPLVSGLERLEHGGG